MGLIVENVIFRRSISLFWNIFVVVFSELFFLSFADYSLYRGSFFYICPCLLRRYAVETFMVYMDWAELFAFGDDESGSAVCFISR